MQIEVSTVDEVKWALMNKFMKLECSYVLKVAAVCNLWSLISSAQQIDKSYLMEGSQIPYVREHRPTAAPHVLYIKSHMPPRMHPRNHAHTDQLCEMTVCHIALPTLFRFTAALVLKSSLSSSLFIWQLLRKDCSPICCFLLSTCTFFDMLEHLEDLRDKGNSVSVTQALWKCM